MFFTILDGNRILSDNKLTLICILERLVGFIYNGIRYFYQRNIQGDITAIYNEDGNLVNKYVYDAYGRHKVLTSTLEEDLDESSVGNLNPFRYRGYYYDRILRLYFLTNRYYDPVNKLDPSGNLAITIGLLMAIGFGVGAIIGAGTSVIGQYLFNGCSWKNFN